jgi:hypothetical protein
VTTTGRALALAASATVVFLVVPVAAIAPAGASRAEPTPSAATPTVEGPVTGGRGAPANAAGFDLASVGYEQDEYFISGTATAYASAVPLTNDGQWTATPTGDPAPYKTRILVARPSDPKKFDGTVYVEWLNDSAGGEATPEWTFAHNEIIREGAAWVGVSAQAVGVVGGTSLVGSILQPLVKQDPDRYGTLVHPGDSYSYDIFSQAGMAVRARTGVKPLGPVRPSYVIAIGDSQSAFRLTTYVDAIEPVTHVYDGFLVQSREGNSAPLSQAPLTTINAPNPTYIRDDTKVPVLLLTTETDLVVLGYRTARQPDTKTFRDWEVAGTSHADSYTLSGGNDTGDGAGDITLFNAMVNPPASPPLGCAPAINAGDETYVVRAALYALRAWIVDGAPPAHSSKLQLDGTNLAYALDAHGNALGGIRTPVVDAPVAQLSGIALSTNSGLCRLFGVTKPFDASALASLYPTHAAFVQAWDRAANAAVKAGFILRADAVHLEAAAAQSSVGAH